MTYLRFFCRSKWPSYSPPGPAPAIQVYTRGGAWRCEGVQGSTRKCEEVRGGARRCAEVREGERCVEMRGGARRCEEVRGDAGKCARARSDAALISTQRKERSNWKQRLTRDDARTYLNSTHLDSVHFSLAPHPTCLPSHPTLPRPRFYRPLWPSDHRNRWHHNSRGIFSHFP